MSVGIKHTYHKHKHGNSLLDIKVNPINESRKSPYFLQTQNKLLQWSSLKLRNKVGNSDKTNHLTTPAATLVYCLLMPKHNLEFHVRDTNLETDYYKVRHCTRS